MNHVMNHALDAARKLAERVEALTIRIEGEVDDEIEQSELVEAGGEIPIAILTAYCQQQGVELPEDLQACLSALPQAYDWGYDISELGVVSEKLFPQGIYGGFLWFNKVARGGDLAQCLDLAHAYSRPQCAAAVIPFIEINNGDVIAVVLPAGEVWFLDHEDPNAGSCCLTPSVSEFYARWAAMDFAYADHQLIGLFNDPAQVAAYHHHLEQALAATECVEDDLPPQSSAIGAFDPGFPENLAAQFGENHPLARAARQAHNNIERVAPGFTKRKTRTKSKESGDAGGFAKKRWWWPFDRS